MSPALYCATELIHVRIKPTDKLQHDCWVLDYNFTGGEYVKLASHNAPWVERPARVAHLYPPGLAYWEDSNGDGKPVFVHCAYVLFADSGHLQLDRLLTSGSGHACFFDVEGLLGELLGETVRIAAVDGDNGYWQAHARLFDMVALLHHASDLGHGTYSIQGLQTTPGQSEFVRRVRKYMHAHLSEPITLADLAREVGFSESTLSHRFRIEVGESPMTTLKRARINRAKVLLEKGYRLKEIAAQAGFFDEFHLSKTFKQVEGVSPRAYRAGMYKMPVV
jgi:AraC-like DNA-binding protein